MIEKIVKNHMDEINSLKDDIIRETDVSLAELKAKIIIDTIDFFKFKLKSLQKLNTLFDSGGESEQNSDSSIGNNDTTDNISVSSEETYYSYTESEYNFDDTEDILKNRKDDRMMEFIHELKKRENHEMIKISKKREFV